MTIDGFKSHAAANASAVATRAEHHNRWIRRQAVTEFTHPGPVGPPRTFTERQHLFATAVEIQARFDGIGAIDLGTCPTCGFGCTHKAGSRS